MLPHRSKFKLYVSFPRLPFFKLTSPHSRTALQGFTIHILERQMIPSGYLNSQLRLQPEFPRPGRWGKLLAAAATASGQGAKQPVLSKERGALKTGRHKSSLFTPLKHGKTAEYNSSNRMMNAPLSQSIHLQHWPKATFCGRSAPQTQSFPFISGSQKKEPILPSLQTLLSVRTPQH